MIDGVLTLIRLVQPCLHSYGLVVVNLSGIRPVPGLGRAVGVAVPPVCGPAVGVISETPCGWAVDEGLTAGGLLTVVGSGLAVG